jgi:hypothetical protein
MRHLFRSGTVGVKEDHRKLLPPVATGKVRTALDLLLENLCEAHKDLVPGDVTVTVVVLLEMVDIQHEEREGTATAPGKGDLLFQPVVKVATVVDLGERVVEAELFELGVCLLQSLVLLTHQGALPDSNHPVDHRAEQQEVEQKRPPSPPQRRLNEEQNCRRILRPDAVVITRPNLKRVLPRWEGGVARIVSRSGVNPLPVETFEHVGVLVALRSLILQTDKLERDELLIRRHLHRVSVKGVAVVAQRFLEYPHVGYVDPGSVGIAKRLGLIDAGDAVGRPEKEGSVLVPIGAGIELDAGKTVIFVEIRYVSGFGINNLDPLMRCNPEPAELIFENRDHDVACQPVARENVSEALALFHEPVESTAHRGYPDAAGAILVNRSDGVAAEATAICGAVDESSKALGLRLKKIKTVVRGDPDPALRVLEDIVNQVIRERGGILRVVVVGDELSCLRVEYENPAGISADPKAPSAVLFHGVDYLVRQWKLSVKISAPELKEPRLPVKPINPPISTDKKLSISGLEELVNNVVCQGVWVFGVVSIGDDTVTLFDVPVETAVVEPEPENPLSISGNDVYLAPGKRARIILIVSETAKVPFTRTNLLHSSTVGADPEDV